MSDKLIVRDLQRFHADGLAKGSRVEVLPLPI